jgi:hypothetical protein
VTKSESPPVKHHVSIYYFDFCKMLMSLGPLALILQRYISLSVMNEGFEYFLHCYLWANTVYHCSRASVILFCSSLVVSGRVSHLEELIFDTWIHLLFNSWKLVYTLRDLLTEDFPPVCVLPSAHDSLVAFLCGPRAARLPLEKADHGTYPR